MNKDYYLLLKTGDAEFRALSNLSEPIKDSFLPIIELTRGRKLKGKDEWPIKSRVDKICEIFKNKTICLDLTSTSQLSCDDITELYNPADGYKNWLNFLIELRDGGAFQDIIPCIIANFNDDDFLKNYQKQINALKSNFKTIAYRSSLKDDGCYDDFEVIKDIISDDNFICIIDCEYITGGSWRTSFAPRVTSRINNSINILGNKTRFVVCSTSFPNNISTIGHDISDAFKLNEIDLYNEVRSSVSNMQISISYGDYGSINPERNDGVVMARGWIPRIDIPTESEIYYYRERKGDSDYSSTYIKVARYVMRDTRFPRNLKCWGINQVLICADGATPGSSPSFWISVRMNIHINQQIKRLSK